MNPINPIDYIYDMSGTYKTAKPQRFQLCSTQLKGKGIITCPGSMNKRRMGLRRELKWLENRGNKIIRHLDQNADRMIKIVNSKFTNKQALELDRHTRATAGQQV